jgi:geranylgeranyl pyrophosphate synthase
MNMQSTISAKKMDAMEISVTSQTPVPAASLAEYQPYRAIIERRIYDSIAGTTPEMLRMALRHAASGGKRIRPMLTVISTLVVGGKAADALDAAVAVELVHASSLVHDDIMDASNLRRGKPTVHTLFGRSMAILAGDMLLALAFRSIGRVRPERTGRSFGILTEAFAETCEGQGVDILEGGTRKAERGMHLLMVEKKTARLIEAAATLGGLLGGAPEGSLEALSGFGYNIGMAYQAKDDLLDVIATEAVTEKSVGVDRKNGRTTFATVAPGGEQEVEGIVAGYTARAFAFLAQLPQTRHRENLKALAEALVGRSK